MAERLARQLIAVSRVSLGPGASYRPGQPFEADEAMADELVSLGAAAYADAEEAAQAARGPDPEPALPPLTDVKGIGRQTALALAGAGVTDLAALAGLDDDTLAGLAQEIGKSAAAVGAWRDAARGMLP